jgi:hypothetical protein
VDQECKAESTERPRQLASAHRGGMALADLLRRRRHADTGLADPDPTVRLAYWRNIARRHISVQTCMDLADKGFPELARELMRQRGDIE